MSPATLTLLRDAMVVGGAALARDWSPGGPRLGLARGCGTGGAPSVHRGPELLGSGRLRGAGRAAARRVRRRQAQPDIHPPADGLHGRGGFGERGAAAATVVLGAAGPWPSCSSRTMVRCSRGAAARHRDRGGSSRRGGAAGTGALDLVADPVRRTCRPIAAYGRSRNYGLLATFLTPLVVVLIDLLSPAGWRLAEDRLIDHADRLRDRAAHRVRAVAA